MASTMLRLRITGTAGAYKVGAEVEDRQTTDDFANLPTDFAKSLQLTAVAEEHISFQGGSNEFAY
jgi:hypothetical protein